MGLAMVLAALHIFSRQYTQGDPEKAHAQSGGSIQDDGQAVTDDDSDEVHDRDRLGEHSRKTRHRPATFDSASSTSTGWISRTKSYIFPSDENEATLEQFIPNYRWTPIISGVVIPFSILLEIPGLTEHWYIRTEANQVVETKSNPVILRVGLAISISCGLFANICIVMRFLERRVKTTTLLTIIFLTAHDLINIVAITVFGVEHRFDDGFTYGQSFWITLCSTIASTITNVTLILDYVRTPEFARSGSGLTRKQRALVIIVIVLMVYIALGALINSLIQGLDFIDGLYFTVVTIETIGFGDITPKSTGARVFTCIYMAFGILNVGIAVAMTRETVLEGLELGYRRRLRNLRLRRREARRFRRWEARWSRAVQWRLREAGQPIWVPDEHLPNEEVHFIGLSGPGEGAGEVHWLRKWLESFGLKRHRSNKGARIFPHGKHLNIAALTPQQLEAAALEAGVPLELFLSPPSTKRASDEDRGPTNSNGPGNSRSRAPPHGQQSSTNGWPTSPQTPTHAQMGRMAAMVTKFGMTLTGTHVHMIGHAAETHPSQQRQEEAQRDAEPKHGNAVFFDENDPESNDDNGEGVNEGDDEQHASGSPQLPQIGTLTAEGSLHPDLPKWTKDLALGKNEQSGILYEDFKAEMESEEKKAYYAKLSVAWSLFLIFWTVGSAIFSSTEGWTYGDALYFCFMAFTTTGYGDFAPASPAGRSVFVVWALMGVATMTILIAVLEEACSSRYKSVLHSKTFDSAVKKFRQQENEETNRIHAQTKPQVARKHSASSITDATVAAKEVAQHELERLPNEIIREARTFHEHMQYFVNNGGNVEETMAMESQGQGSSGVASRIPNELRELLDQISEYEGIGERAKREILEDSDSRNTLLMLSIERTLRKLINAAERSLGALAERDSLIVMQNKNNPDDAHDHEQEHEETSKHETNARGTRNREQLEIHE